MKIFGFTIVAADVNGECIYSVYWHRKLLFALYNVVDGDGVSEWKLTAETHNPSVSYDKVQHLGLLIESEYL